MNLKKIILKVALYILSNVFLMLIIGFIGYLNLGAPLLEDVDFYENIWYLILAWLWLFLFLLHPLFIIRLSHSITVNVFFQILLIFFSIGYIIFTSTCFERYLLDKKLETFDIDKDTIFAPYEQTSEQQKYFHQAVNDTDVLFRYVIAFPYAVLVSLLYTIFYMIKKIVKKKEYGKQ